MTTKGRISRRTAVAATAMTVFATPAFASLVIQSYMRADITVADNCLVSRAGSDVASYTTAAGPDADFATGNMAPTRVTFEEDTLTIRGMQGDRVIYTDVARIRNECDVPLTVQLNMDGSQGGGWTDRYAEVYLSSVALPLDSVQNLGFPTDSSGNWVATPLAVDSGGNVVNAQSSVVPVGPNQEIRIATLIEAGTTPSSLSATSSMSWEVMAQNNNGN